jgi:hypothetical protein
MKKESKKPDRGNVVGPIIETKLKVMGKGNSWLAREVDVSPSAVTGWIETGKISLEKAFRVAEALKMTIYELFEEPAPKEFAATSDDIAVPKDKLFLTYVDVTELDILSNYRQSTVYGKAIVKAAAVGAEKAPQDTAANLTNNHQT